jgi:anti-sigma B factor antagonist
MAQAADPQDPRPLPGDVSVFFDDGVTLVIMTGEVDLAIAADLEDAGRDAISRGVPVRIDMRTLSFIDSAGVAFVARLVAAADATDMRLTVSGASRAVIETLAVAGLAPLLDFDG